MPSAINVNLGQEFDYLDLFEFFEDWLFLENLNFQIERIIFFWKL